MTFYRIQFALTLFILALSMSCRTTKVFEDFAVTSGSNTERYILTWKRNDGKLPYSCIEFTGPGAREHNLTASQTISDVLKIPGIAEKNETITNIMQYNQKVVTMYTVTEVLQFGHAGLFNLCQAHGNGSISDAQYFENFAKLMTTIRRLLELAMKGEASPSPKPEDPHYFLPK
ncbi:hypothetical protein [Leptospira sp. GIMC2001]|uniref:hypothetical protein n=1 Tax=Leptospira sp. GIMC2001 TaxID=1513297 RepID=UPI002349D389|nr:hypothetical protein [Leptospira sp. GIMC2001]WCL51474.1 hypothetical protein O4O04_20370 [Leptospira sp. GIMC2001]